MIEIYTEPAAPERSAFSDGSLVEALLILLAIAAVVGLIALAVFIAEVICKHRGDDEDRRHSVRVLTGLTSTAVIGVLALSGCVYAEAQGHIDRSDSNYQAYQEALAEHEAEIEQHHQATVEQFTNRYGELVFLRCTAGQCREEEDLYEELAEEWAGGSTTRDVSFYDAAGVLVEDAYLLKQDSDDDGVEFTVRLMVRESADEAYEYSPEGGS